MSSIPTPPKGQRNQVWDGIERRKNHIILLQMGARVYYSLKNKLDGDTLTIGGDKISYRKCDYV